MFRFIDWNNPMKINNSIRNELCASSSLCSCDLLARMHQNFLKKFKLRSNEQLLDNDAESCLTEMKAILSDSSPSTSAVELSITEDRSESNDILRDEVPFVATGSKKDEDGSMHYEILNEESRTPVPIYEMMSETELNAELAKYGHGPMGKRAAIRLLNQIFEATHPVLSATTPIPRKIARLLLNKQPNANADICRQKRVRAKIARLMEPTNFIQLDDDNDVASSIPNADPQTSIEKENRTESNHDIPSLSQIFLEWLRRPQNEELYNDLLLLNPVFFDRLYPQFKQDSKEHARFSKETFAEMLDKLGITHCSRNSIEDQ